VNAGVRELSRGSSCDLPFLREGNCQRTAWDFPRWPVYTRSLPIRSGGRKAPPGDAAFGAGDRPAEFCASPHRSAWTSVPGPLLLSRSSAASERGSRGKCNVCLGVPVNGESKSARPNFLEATACPNSAIQYWRCAHAMSTCATFEGIIAPPGKGPLSELRR